MKYNYKNLHTKIKIIILFSIILISCSSVAIAPVEQLECDPDPANNYLYDVYQGGKKIDELCTDTRESKLYFGSVYLIKKGAPCRCQ